MLSMGIALLRRRSRVDGGYPGISARTELTSGDGYTRRFKPKVASRLCWLTVSMSWWTSHQVMGHDLKQVTTRRPRLDALTVPRA